MLHAWLLLAAVADPAMPWSTPSERRELPMRPKSIPFACPLGRDHGFPIAFIARPQLLTHHYPLPWERHLPPFICACVDNLVRTSKRRANALEQC